jgi:hypothetical protein
MADRAPLKATFFVFGKRDRAVLLPATIVIVVSVALIVGAFIAINWPTIAEFAELARQSGEPPNEEASMRLVGRMFSVVGMAFLFLFPLYFAVAAYEAGCLRWMIRGEAPGLYGLTLDRDMWRIYGIYWCWFLAQMAVSIATSLLLVPVVFVMMGNLATASPETMFQRQMMVQIPLMILQYGVLIFLGVRFGPAAATTIACRQFAFFRAWKVTEGRFWTLLGSFALVFVGAGVWSVLVFGAFAISILGGAMKQWPHVDAAVIFSPTRADSP